MICFLPTAFCFVHYCPPPPPLEEPLRPEVEWLGVVEQDIALAKELPSEVAKFEAVIGFQPGPEYQWGE
jgi:hypothetical protein